MDKARPTSADTPPNALINRESSWLAFASRVIAMAEDSSLPLLERVKFVSIGGMLHDEFFMKRISGLQSALLRKPDKVSSDGLTPAEELAACREEVRAQAQRLATVLTDDLCPALRKESLPILNWDELSSKQAEAARDYLLHSVVPILTPLAVDSEHPFPFVSNFGLNLAVFLADGDGRHRFLRIKVPDNRPRWVSLPDGGWIALEQVIAANLDFLSTSKEPTEIHMFRVTRGAEGTVDQAQELVDRDLAEPGRIIRQVSNELKARRFAGVVRLQVDPDMPKKFRKWLAKQLNVDSEDVYSTSPFLGLNDFAQLEASYRPDLYSPEHLPVAHPRLAKLAKLDPCAIFDEISRGDVLLHHPYHSFDSSVLRLIESAAVDPDVLAIKLTIYRTNRDSPIVRALAEAARRGKQVAVLVEVTARFDEAPNIAWGQYLEKEGVHVAYGVQKLKTHVKLALVVREENDSIRRYAHVGTGNYHTGTARLYEDLGILTANREICDDVGRVFNALTGATHHDGYRQMLVAPFTMRKRFQEMIWREIGHARAGRPSGIDAKMNQLQDPGIIHELYEASRAGVPIRLNVRGLCCLRPGVPDLSENIRVFGVVGRFLEHSRVFRFENGGEPEHYLGSADWMKRNLDRRVETIVPVLDRALSKQIDAILATYENDNCSVWDCRPDGTYRRRRPAKGESERAAQLQFIEMARRKPDDESSDDQKQPPLRVVEGG